MRAFAWVSVVLLGCGGGGGGESNNPDAGGDASCGTPEVCDQRDNDCDFNIDEGLTCGCVPTCDRDALCTLNSGRRQCICRDGYEGDGLSCVDINECAADNGGCDSLTACTNVMGAPRTCGDCPDGYATVSATECAPTLTGLALSPGVLRPAFRADVIDYIVGFALETQSVALTPTAPAGATIAINGDPVVSGAAWQSPTLDLGDTAITIVVSHAGHPSSTYQVVVNRSAQQAYIKASNPQDWAEFGHSIAISGDTLVIGAPGEDSASTGVNGTGASDGAIGSGAAYVFVRVGETWSQQAYLKASNTAVGDHFGTSVAISGDTIVVGAPDEDRGEGGLGIDDSSGSAYVFVRNGTAWSQQAYLKADLVLVGARFGTSVAVSISPVSSKIVVGAPGANFGLVRIDEGAAYVFNRNGVTWSQDALLRHPEPQPYDVFGQSVAISGFTVAVGAAGDDSGATGIDGSATDDSATDSGAVVVFSEVAGNWSQEGFIKPSNTDENDAFGHSVALWGTTLVVGAPGECSAAIGINGDQADNSAVDTGAAYVFVHEDMAWSQQAYLKPAYTMDEQSFGKSVSIRGSRVAIGAPDEDSDALGLNSDPSRGVRGESGAVYVFAREGTVWSRHTYLKASNPDAGDRFGSSVAISVDLVGIGAVRESSNATGINGDQSNNDVSAAGAAYVHPLM